MTGNPLVSVIIPFLNPGSWLSEAIDSVLAQTYTNWEIILIDDGSVEADTVNAMGYANRHREKIFYCMHEGHINKGLTASRNLGVQKAKGTFIAFLDADDCWMPLKLERQLGLFAAMPAVQMICEASVFWFSWADAGKENYLQLIGAPEGLYEPPQLISLLYPFGWGQPPCPSGIMIRRQAVLRNGGFEESFSGMYQLYEDQAFLFKIYCNEIVYISAEANNRYRKREDSMCSAAGNPEIYSTVRKFFAGWVQRYLDQKHGHSPVLNNLLKEFNDSLQTAEPVNQE